MTPAESIIWKRFRNRAFADFKFRRQHGIGPYFVDLACHECKVVIELDGETHLGHEAEDARRSRYLEAEGWLVLRFWNNQVYDELEGVLEAVYKACKERGAIKPSGRRSRRDE